MHAIHRANSSSRSTLAPPVDAPTAVAYVVRDANRPRRIRLANTMRYLVCIKQVPVVARLEFDPERRALRREGVPTEVSSFDLRALLRAIELREQTGGEVVALTMGPPQAQEALDYCLALGADRSVHLCDPAFAGADTLATARTLARAIEIERADLILLGRYSVDAETSQVGPEIAEILGLPQVLAAHRLDLDPATRTAEAECETDEGYVTVRTSLPAVVTAAEDLAEERFPRKADREAAADKPCSTVSLANLGLPADQVGAAGSPTWVADLQEVASNRLGRVFRCDEDANAIASVVSALVDEHGLFSTWRLPGGNAPVANEPAVTRPNPGSLWCVGDVDDSGKVSRASLEIVARLRTLADRSGTDVSAVVLRSCAPGQRQQLADAGADRVLTPGAPLQQRLTTDVATLTSAIEAQRPGVVIFPATTFGRAVAPGVAARLGLGLTSDCVGLDWDADGRLLQYKPAFGGSVVAPVLSRTLPEMATVRPGVLDPPTGKSARPLVVEPLDVASPPPGARDVDIVESRTLLDQGSELDTAEIVIGVGMGVGGPEGIAQLMPLVEVLGARLCATRDVTDAGWLPRQVQVGLTGRSIAPKLYIGFGIRGAFEHTVGLRRAGVLVAVNKNPKAMVFKGVDYGIVGEFANVLPELVQQLQARRSE